jgi:thiamine-phosphate pyrophosphorylase
MVTAPARGEAAESALIARVAAAAGAGVHLVQVRDPGLEGGPLERLVARCVAAVRGSNTRIIVNDRLDVALAAGAHGVHLRGDSIPASRARTLAPDGFVIGRSVHGVDEARRADAAGGLDYLIFGTVFPTTSKAGADVAGAEALAAVVRSTSLPVLAIGGISVETAARAGAAGAAGFAAIGLFTGANDRLPLTVAQVSRAFDTPVGRS